MFCLYVCLFVCFVGFVSLYCFGHLGFTLAGCGVLVLIDGHNQILLGHEIVFSDEMRKSVAKIRFSLKLIEYATMMKVCMRENAIDASTHRSQLGHRRLLD